MNKLLLLIFLLPLASFAQTEAPKGAKKITIANSLSAEENFKLIGELLLDNDLAIENKDSDLLTYSTQLKRIPKRSGSYSLNVRAKENAIIISGRFNLGVELELYGVRSTDSFYEIENKGAKGSVGKLAWVEMDNFAKTISKEVEYK